MLRGPGINAAMQRANQPEINYPWLSYYNSSAPLSKVEVENMGSADFTKLIFVKIITKVNVLLTQPIVVPKSKILLF